MPALTPLVILGAGGLGREVAEAVRAVNATAPTWDLLGFLDDRAPVGRADGELPVLGPTGLVHELRDAMVVACVGSPAGISARQRFVTRLGLAEERFATIVHPSAVIPPSASIGAGSVVLATVVATTGVRIGRHSVLMPGVTLTHDDVVGEFVTFASGVRLAGGVTVGDSAYLGAAACVREHRSIGERALVGMGSVVLHDVPAGEVWVGSPARFMRRVNDGVDARAG